MIKMCYDQTFNVLLILNLGEQIQIINLVHHPYIVSLNFKVTFILFFL